MYPHLQNINRSDYLETEDITNSRFFVVATNDIHNIHKAIKYGIWTSTGKNNQIFDGAWINSKKNNCNKVPQNIYLYFWIPKNR